MSARPKAAPASAVDRRRPPAELPMGSAADAPHGSRPEQVYARLRDLIVQGLLAPGSRIVETEIATRLGVSRTPVREALQRLQQEGYVMGSPGAQQSRLTVAPLTRDDVYELLNIVGALEGMGARGAALVPPNDRRNLDPRSEESERRIPSRRQDRADRSRRAVRRRRALPSAHRRGERRAATARAARRREAAGRALHPDVHQHAHERHPDVGVRA